MGQSLANHLPWRPWAHKGAGIVVVIVIVVVGLSLALSAVQIAACTGLFSAIAGVAALTCRTERGPLRRHA